MHKLERLVIRPTRKIAFYDQKMTLEVTTHQARNRKPLGQILRTGTYMEVFINLGQTYLTALQPLEAWLSNGVALRFAEGGEKKGQVLHCNIWVWCETSLTYLTSLS